MSAYSAMAQGIIHADRVNTVSDTYAKEILTPEYGAGLDALLRARSAVVSGIVNGIDYDEFNPATDPAIPAHFSVDALDVRAEDKHGLQREAGLPEADALLFGVVTRLFAQKGIDLVAQVFGPILERSDAQLAVLGTGDPDVHRQLLDLEARFPKQVKIWLEFNPPLGQRVYAGCDVFLMPSRYEPCGLGQLISLRYGAVPLVRRTGGLADTVQDADAALTSRQRLRVRPRRRRRAGGDRRAGAGGVPEPRGVAGDAGARHATGLVVGPRGRTISRTLRSCTGRQDGGHSASRNVSEGLYAGIDLGGTKILVLVADTRGSVLGTARVPTLATQGPDSVIARIVDAVHAAAAEAQRRDERDCSARASRRRGRSIRARASSRTRRTCPGGTTCRWRASCASASASRWCSRTTRTAAQWASTCSARAAATGTCCS